MSTEICLFCGENIRFRNINGRPTPLHPTGSSCPGKKLYREEEKEACHYTNCPRCGGNVYFIRHNGGCAWFDELGRPWDKHACFADDNRLPAWWSPFLDDGWKPCYLQLVGVLTDGTGGVFGIFNAKPERRAFIPRDEQCRLQRKCCERDEVLALDGKTVLLRSDGDKIVSPKNQEWALTIHTPKFARKPYPGSA